MLRPLFRFVLERIFLPGTVLFPSRLLSFPLSAPPSLAPSSFVLTISPAPGGFFSGSRMSTPAKNRPGRSEGGFWIWLLSYFISPPIGVEFPRWDLLRSGAGAPKWLPRPLLHLLYRGSGSSQLNLVFLSSSSVLLQSQLFSFSSFLPGRMCPLGLGPNQGNTDAIHGYTPLIRSLGIVSFSFPVPGLGPRTTSMSFAEMSFRMIRSSKVPTGSLEVGSTAGR